MGELNQILFEVEKNGYSEQIWTGIHNTIFTGDNGFNNMKEWAHKNGLVFSEESRVDRKWGKHLVIRFRKQA